MSKQSQLAQHKLILLYLVERTGIPLSNSEICQFALEKKYMDYFTVQQYLSELVSVGYLEKSKENNHTRYTITQEGSDVLSYFANQLTPIAKYDVNQYISDNSKRIKSEFEVTANYFPEADDQFLVKCGVYDCNGENLMEISAVVATRDQARRICNNWRKNVNILYGSILSSLASENPISAQQKK